VTLDPRVRGDDNSTDRLGIVSPVVA